tara:strand:+ start:463 stop:636 length:174 start_codon:yes stop_codon:yes gene_type:complete
MITTEMLKAITTEIYVSLMAEIHDHVFGLDSVERYTHQELLDRLDYLVESEHERSKL